MIINHVAQHFLGCIQPTTLSWIYESVRATRGLPDLKLTFIQKWIIRKAVKKELACHIGEETLRPGYLASKACTNPSFIPEFMGFVGADLVHGAEVLNMWGVNSLDGQEQPLVDHIRGILVTDTRFITFIKNQVRIFGKIGKDELIDQYALYLGVLIWFSYILGEASYV